MARSSLHQRSKRHPDHERGRYRQEDRTTEKEAGSQRDNENTDNRDLNGCRPDALNRFRRILLRCRRQIPAVMDPGRRLVAGGLVCHPARTPASRSTSFVTCTCPCQAKQTDAINNVPAARGGTISPAAAPPRWRGNNAAQPLCGCAGKVPFGKMRLVASGLDRGSAGWNYRHRMRLMSEFHRRCTRGTSFCFEARGVGPTPAAALSHVKTRFAGSRA